MGSDERIADAFRVWNQDKSDEKAFLVYLAELHRGGRHAKVRNLVKQHMKNANLLPVASTGSFSETSLAHAAVEIKLSETIALGVASIAQVNITKLLQVYAHAYKLDYKCWQGMRGVSTVACHRAYMAILHKLSRFVMPLRQLVGAESAELILRRVSLLAREQAKRTARGLARDFKYQPMSKFIDVPVAFTTLHTKRYPGQVAVACPECSRYHEDDVPLFYVNASNLYLIQCHVCDRLLKENGLTALRDRPT